MLSRNYQNKENSHLLMMVFTILLIIPIILIIYNLIFRKNVKTTLVSAFDEAKLKFNHDSVLTPFSTTSTGVTVGFLSFLYHGNTPNQLKKDLKSCLTDSESIKIFTNHLKHSGCLYSGIGNPYQFENYMLQEIRVNNIALYKEIIGSLFGIKFLDNNSVTLYRRDGRRAEEIFEQGFKLKSGWLYNPNAAHINKDVYVDIVTYDHGVSTAKTIPPVEYSPAKSMFSEARRHYYYVIKFPKNHNFLLVDIVASPRNKNNLSTYRRNLQEINCMQDIPREWITCKVKERQNHMRFFNKVIDNPNINLNFKPAFRANGC